MKQKTHLYTFLMAFSLLLLLLFQMYWLGKVYQEQKELLSKDIDNLFVQNIRDQQDSLFRINMATFRKSLGSDNPRAFFFLNKDSLSASSREGDINQAIVIRFDSSGSRHEHNFNMGRHEPSRGREPENRMQRRERIFKNTLQAVKDGTISPYWGNSFSEQNFADTIPLAFLQNRIQNDMNRAGIQMPIRISRPDTVPDVTRYTGLITFYPAGFPPVHMYVAQVHQYQGYLLRKMIPSTLFAFFLLGITSVSFFLILRGLKQQQKLAKLKNDFISNITHELKTPISTVSVALEALQTFQVLNNPEKTREYLSISQHELQRLAILVDRVLKMSMFEQKALHLHPERFDLQATLQKILQSMGLQFEKAHAKVGMQVEGEQFQVEGDQVHLTNVFYNLLDNALKYSVSNPEINIFLQERNGTVEVSVRDNGIGIDKAYQAKIFEQFFRVPQNDNQHNTKGHGLGLSYVSEVLRNHNGSISLQSKPGEGSTFVVRIPKMMEANKKYAGE